MLEARTTHGTLAGSHHIRSHAQLLLSSSDNDCCAYPTPHSPCPGRGQQKPEIVSLQLLRVAPLFPTGLSTHHERARRHEYSSEHRHRPMTRLIHAYALSAM